MIKRAIERAIEPAGVPLYGLFCYAMGLFVGSTWW